MPDVKRGTKAIFILAIATVAGVVGFLFYKAKKSSFLNAQLQELVKNKTNQLYNITYDSIYVNEVNGNLSITNLHVKGDTARQLQMLKQGDTNAAKIIMDAYIPALEVVSFKTAKALLSQRLVCNKVIITNPRINIYLFPGQVRQKDEKKQREDFYKQILGNLKLIKADSVAVENSEIIATDFYTKETKFHTYHTSASLLDVAIDSTYNEDTSRIFFCKEIKVTSDKIILGDKDNTAQINNLLFDTRSEVLSLRSFSYDAFKSKGFFKSRFDGILLKGWSILGPLENLDLSINNAELDSAEIETMAGSVNSKTARQSPKLILSGLINSFGIHSFHVKSANYIVKQPDKKSNALQVNNTSVLLQNVFIDRKAVMNQSLITKAENIELRNNEINLVSRDKMYTFRISGVVANTQANKISVASLRIIPKLNEAVFAKKAQYQKDRYNVNFRNIDCKNVNMERLLKGEIVIDNITTANNSINIFRDRSYPIDSAKKIGRQESYPHQLLHKLDLPIEINKFAATNTTINYKEKNPKSNSSGIVHFSNSSITVTNISNYQPRRKERIEVNFKGDFLNKIPVGATITFFTDQWKTGRFSVEVKIFKSFDAALLNQLVQPLALAKIDKGIIESLDFNIIADTSIATGTLSLGYKDLKISLMKKKGNEYNKKGLFSMLANILVKNSNETAPDMRKGKIEVKPDKFKSFFNYIWVCVFSGAKDILMFTI